REARPEFLPLPQRLEHRQVERLAVEGRLRRPPVLAGQRQLRRILVAGGELRGIDPRGLPHAVVAVLADPTPLVHLDPAIQPELAGADTELRVAQLASRLRRALGRRRWRL